jgi:thiol-disulfide isomerase/thioredoxin
MYFGTQWAKAQDENLTLPLSSARDTTANSFKYILPESNRTQVIFPKLDIKYSTLSRSLNLTSLGKVLTIMIGKDIKGIDFIVFDSNSDLDLTNDEVIYFTDSVTSPTKGNYRHYKSKITVNNMEVPISFDYSIIKPKALNISFNDTLEDKIHFMVRSNEYKYGEVFYEGAKHPIVLFTSGIYDFSKKSTFLISASFKWGLDSLKSMLSRGSNKYVPGDIAILGNEKFVFEGLTPLGDSIVLRSISGKSDLLGVKVGFVAPNFEKRDILSKRQLLLNSMRGKYVLLDFWGTWCAPCMQIMGGIERLHKNSDPKLISMIGICYDDNPSKVEAFIKKKGIDWNQIFDARSKSELSKLFGITAYPSFILIDPHGKIIFRDEGINGFQRLSDQLAELVEK